MNAIGAVLIEGCKWCGKSTTGKEHVKNIIEFQDVDRIKEYEVINSTKPSLFLEGEKPLLIDEWQMYPIVWDAVRNSIDKTGLQGQYILTGSTKVDNGKVMHSGTGRIVRILMRPMSLYESKESDGKISLEDLFNNNIEEFIKSDLTFEKIIRYIIRGGWPLSLNIEEHNEVAINYYKSLIHEKINVNNEIEYNSDKMAHILKSLARNISSITNITTIEKDILANNGNISRSTLDDYIDTLKKLYILENVPSWNGKLRSKIAIRTKEKIQFVDPSLACAALGATEGSLRKDLNTLGLLFESLCIRDLRIYTDYLGGKLYYYKDETDLEIDAIIELSDGRWGAFEIKMGAGFIDEAADSLLKFKNKIDTDKIGEPCFLAVLTGTDYSYKRDDGIYVISLANLKN